MQTVFKSFIVSIILISCGTSDLSEKDQKGIREEKNRTHAGNTLAANKQLNINILWDLSDRIDSLKNPSAPQHYERDIEVIKTIVSIFREDMKNKGAYKAKGKLRVFFSPVPENAAINSIARNLVCDLSEFSGEGANKKKKSAYDSIEQRFSNNANRIYKLAVDNNKNRKQWDGSDIWRFFKNDVKEYCIDNDSGYRNILVILTDGYIYHKDSRMKDGNKTTYILPENLKAFRKSNKWKEVFDSGSYGLIASRHDLQNLEILVLEVNPSVDNKNDEDLIKAYLEKWFEEMGLQKGNYAIYNSALPEYTRNKIESFFNHQ